MKIKLYFYCVLIIGILCAGSAQARFRTPELAELIDLSDIVASVTATQVLQKDDTLICELLADKFFKHPESIDKKLTITIPKPRLVATMPRTASFVQGQRYLVFLTQQDPALSLSHTYLGAIHLRGEKKMRNYILDGSPAKAKRFNEPELLARVQELTADITEPTQMPKTEKPLPQPKKPQKTQKAEGNAAPYYEKAISLYVEQPESLSRLGCDESGCKVRLPEDTPVEKKAALTKWLKANEKAFEQLHLAATKSYCRFKFKDTGDKLQAALNRNSQIMRLLKALRWRMELQISNSEYPEALEDALVAYSLGAQLAAGPKVLIEQLVGFAAQAAASRTVFATLDKQNLDVAFMARLQTIFEDVTAKYGGSFDLEGEKNYMQNQIKNDPAHRSFRQHLKGALEYYDLVAKKTPWQLKNDKAAEKLTAGNMLLQAAPGIARAAETHHRANVSIQALTTTIAALRYKTDTGKVPKNLNELITAGYLKALPMDPYSDKSLVYKPTGDSFTLYSVGADFNDDRGKHDKKWGADGGDYVFWPVQYPKNK